MIEYFLLSVPYRGIAQLVEQRSPKPRAVSSNLTAPAIIGKDLRMLVDFFMRCFFIIHSGKFSGIENRLPCLCVVFTPEYGCACFDAQCALAALSFGCSSFAFWTYKLVFCSMHHRGSLWIFRDFFARFCGLLSMRRFEKSRLPVWDGSKCRKAQRKKK